MLPGETHPQTRRVAAENVRSRGPIYRPRRLDGPILFLLSFPGWTSEITGKDIANQTVAHRLRLCPSTLILQQILRRVFFYFFTNSIPMEASRKNSAAAPKTS